MVSPDRIAVLGGDGRQSRHFSDGVRFYKSNRTAGNGELRRLEKAIRSGSIDLVIILARWCGHSASQHIRRLCRSQDIEVQFLRGSNHITRSPFSSRASETL